MQGARHDERRSGPPRTRLSQSSPPLRAQIGHAFVKASVADWHADSLLCLREEMRTLAHADPGPEEGFGDALHGDAIVHDDVRADNILISDGRAHLLNWPHARREPRGPTCPVCWPSVEASGGPSCEEAWAVF